MVGRSPGDPRPLRAGRAVDADRRDVAKGARRRWPDRGRRRGRPAPRGRRPPRGVVSIRVPVPPGMRSAGGVEQDPVGTRGEEARGPARRPSAGVVGVRARPGAPSRPADRPRRRRRRSRRRRTGPRRDRAARDDLGDPLAPGVGGDRDDRAGGRLASDRATRARADRLRRATSSRGVPGTRFSPIASAPARTAARMPSASVMPQTFTERRGARGSPDRPGRGPAATNARRGGGRIGGPDERLADERGIEAGRPPGGDRRGVADAGLGDDEPVVRDERRAAGSPGPVSTVERPQVAVVDPDQRGRRWRAPARARARRGPRRAARARSRGPARRAGRAASPDGGPRAAARGRRPAARRCGSWISSTTNSLARTGIADGRPDGPQVVDGAAEPVGLAEDRDRRRAAGLVGAGAGDDVVVGRRRSRRRTATSA